MNYFNLEAITAPLSTDEGLTHAVFQSILNHSDSTQNDRARMGNIDLGGCWSDKFTPGVGSRDWTLQREKITAQTLTRSSSFIEQALKWLVTDNIVKSVNVSVVEHSPSTLIRVVILTRIDNSTLKIKVAT